MRAANAVIFDVGHVLYDWDIRYLYQDLIRDSAELHWFLSSVLTREWHSQHDAGRPFAETSAELIARFPAQGPLIRAYGPRWLDTIGDPIPGMLALAGRLADADVPLFAITNFSHEFWRMFRPTAPVFDQFHGIVVSGKERLVKPDPAIFELAIERFGITPSQTLFVDDQPANVEAARRAGLLAHRFTDAETLMPVMESLGLPAQQSGR